jgi:FtsZ-interacting cell division protein ZipA
MEKTELTMEKRVASLEQEIAEIKALLKEQVAKSQPAPAMAMAAAAAAAVVVSPAPKAETAPAKKVAPVKEEGISPEIMAVISAAVTHFLGLRARIRHAHMIQPPGANPWAQQGRVFIQASHNLAHR